jgi:hypothetical protein
VLKLGELPFTRGSAKFLDREPGFAEATAKIFVRFSVEGVSAEFYAQLDTAAAWSILKPEIAAEAGIDLASGEPASLSTRLGTKTGYLVRWPLVVHAELGEPLEIEATLFVSPDWTAGNFFGYSGLLEHLRFALDPSANRFYFGPQA